MELTTPKPGVYRDVPFETYLSWDAISNSRINLFRRSPLHFKLNAHPDQTEALTLGEFVHCGGLEPENIASRYAVMPAFELDDGNVTRKGERSFSTSTVYYQTKVEEFSRVNAGKKIVKQELYDKLLGVARALRNHDRAWQYLRAERGETELVLVWIDPETELLCKARLDYATKRSTTDLKTTRDAQNFTKAIATYGYHRQLAHYRGGRSVLMGGEMGEHRIIAVEPTEPYGIRAAPLSDDALDLGESEIRQTLRAIARAYERDEWPCYEDPRAWVMPAWYDSIDQELELTVGGQTVSV